MLRQTEEQFLTQIDALRQKVSDLIDGRAEKTEAIDYTLYELSRVIGKVAVGDYPGELMRALWDDHKRLLHYRNFHSNIHRLIPSLHLTAPPPAKPVEIRDPLLLKLLARMNGERVRLTPRQQRELARRREMRQQMMKLEPPIVLADRPRALPTGDHPIAQAIARLNTLK